MLYDICGYRHQHKNFVSYIIRTGQRKLHRQSLKQVTCHFVFNRDKFCWPGVHKGWQTQIALRELNKLKLCTLHLPPKTCSDEVQQTYSAVDQ